MDHEREEDAEEPENTSQYTTDVMSVEEALEEEAEPELIDSWSSFQKNIDNFTADNTCDVNITELDERSAHIAERTRETAKNAVKPFTEKVQEQKCRIERQLESSDKRLRELLRFGEELVTNIRIATDRREYNRRITEFKARECLLADLRGETIESNAKFENIAARWTELEAYNEPMSLWDQIQDQKANIAEIMKSKDEMIERCQNEVNRLNEQFLFERMRQAADLSCLVERVDNQVELLKEAYKKHINLLENTLEDERQIFAINATEKWHEYFNAMNDNFNEKSENIRSRERFYTEQTARITEQQEELTKTTRIRLEKDCEQLQLELRKTRDTVLMNSEKLDYNYQVLQKRNEENVIVNNQQKRRVARLNEAMVNLRKKMRDCEQDADAVIGKLMDDIQKLHLTITDMEMKSYGTRMNNKVKFDRIWDINYNEVIVNVKRIGDIDKLLHQQILLMPWTPPDIDTYDINIDHKNNQMFKKPPKVKQHRRDLQTLPVETLRLLRNMMRKLSDRGGFLIEERLNTILEPFMEQDRCLVRVNNIFEALRIRNLRDITELTEFFMPYTYCPNCMDVKERDTYPAVYMREAMMKKYDKKFISMLPIFEISTSPRPIDVRKRSTVMDVKPSEPEVKKCSNHYLVMEPIFVLHAMLNFATRKHTKAQNPAMKTTQRMINFITIDEVTIRNYWRSFLKVMPKSKLQMWTQLEHGLNHYLEVLKLRQQYDSECQFLRQQNQELKHLLQKYKI